MKSESSYVYFVLWHNVTVFVDIKGNFWMLWISIVLKANLHNAYYPAVQSVFLNMYAYIKFIACAHTHTFIQVRLKHKFCRYYSSRSTIQRKSFALLVPAPVANSLIFLSHHNWIKKMLCNVVCVASVFLCHITGTQADISPCPQLSLGFFLSLNSTSIAVSWACVSVCW